LPFFHKQDLPYMHMGTLVIPVNAPERYQYYTWDWEGQDGMSTIELLKGLDREDLIPAYVDTTAVLLMGIELRKPEPPKPSEHNPEQKETFQLI